jgi:hypothetical protein
LKIVDIGRIGLRFKEDYVQFDIEGLKIEVSFEFEGIKLKYEGTVWVKLTLALGICSEQTPMVKLECFEIDGLDLGMITGFTYATLGGMNALSDAIIAGFEAVNAGWLLNGMLFPFCAAKDVIIKPIFNAARQYIASAVSELTIKRVPKSKLSFGKNDMSLHVYFTELKIFPDALLATIEFAVDGYATRYA